VKKNERLTQDDLNEWFHNMDKRFQESPYEGTTEPLWVQSAMLAEIALQLSQMNELLARLVAAVESKQGVECLALF